MSRTIRSICVVGDGIVGLSAALAFARALPAAVVTVVPMATDPAALADLLPFTLPSVGRFHAAIGFDELDLVRRGIAQHHLGTRFDEGGGNLWHHGFGDVGRPEGAVPFHQLWLRAHREGRAAPFDAHCTASVIGAAGKFVHPSHDASSPLSSYLYGLRLNPARYRAALLDATAAIPRANGEMRGVERGADGSIAALLVGDERVEAGLFIDCSGPRTLVLSELDPAFDDWSPWLPARSIALSWKDGGGLDPIDHVRRTDDGWHLHTAVSGATLDLGLVDGSEGPTLRPGRRPASFIANVVAFGDAAIAVGPLLGTNLSLAHSAILRAIELLPGRDCHPLELAEYNRLTVQEHIRVRDLLALLETTDTFPPETLARTLTQWRARGRLPFFEEESFTSSSWTQVLIGRGIMPDATSPLAQSVDPDAAANAMADFAQALADLAQDLPPYPAYLAQMGAPS